MLAIFISASPLFDDSNYVGLSRHEFLDALLCIGRMTDNQRPLYVLFHELIESHLYQYLFQNMVDLRRFLKGQEIEKKLHSRLRSNQSLIRLFGRYSAINKNTGYVEEDAWSALTEDLYAIANDVKHGIWKYGGKPTTDQVPLLNIHVSMRRHSPCFYSDLLCIPFSPSGDPVLYFEQTS